MADSVVFMGVAGCGKSSLATLVAKAEQLPFIEGDDYHSSASREKMRQGVALTDADRAGWLKALGELLRQHPQGIVLTCSALKKNYRDQLRKAAFPSNVRFVFLEIDQLSALERVKARASGHFFPSRLVESQFETLETPTTETNVLFVDAKAHLPDLQRQVSAWLKEPFLM